MDDKEIKSLFKRYAKKRVTIICGDRHERRQIKTVIRENGGAEIAEYEDFNDAWAKLQLSATHVLVFSADTQDGLDFLQNIIDSTRFQKTPLIVFSVKFRQQAKLFANETAMIFWEEPPMNGFRVEQALVKVFKKGVMEKSLLGRDSISIEYYTKATDAIGQEKYEEAKELLRLALKEMPDFFEAYLRMVETLIALKDFDTARRVLDRAEAMRPDHPRVLLLKAELAGETQSKEEAIKVMDEVMAQRADDQMFIIEIGNNALDKGWLEDAIRYYETAQSVDPDLIHVYNRLGIAHSRRGEFEKALWMYERALKIDESDAGIYFNIGMTYNRRGEKDKAAEYFKKANALDPDVLPPGEFAEMLKQEG